MLTHPTALDPLAATDDITAAESAMQELVERIIQRLDDAGIPYCLLRNRDDIPSGLLQWSDIDMLVSSEVSAKQLYALFADMNAVQMIPYRDVQASFFFPALDRFLRIDMYYGDPEFRSIPYARNKDILAGRWNDNGIMVAPRIYQPFVVWFSKLLWGKKFPIRYEQMIEEVAREQPEELRRLLTEAFGDKLADRIFNLAIDHRLQESTNLVGECRRALWMNALRKRPVTTLRGLTKQLSLAFKERIHPTGLDVVILGPDGSGKSSVCSTIATMPSRRIPYGYATYEVLYHRVLPTLSSLASKATRRSITPKSNPHNPYGNAPHHPVVWLAKYAYYTLDQWVSEMTWMRLKLARSVLILRDRHLMELTIDARRYRYAGPAVLPRLIARLTPRPDLVIFLDAPPEVVQSRKQDVPMEETIRQRQAYRDLVESLPNGRIVNGNQPFEKVVRDVLDVIAKETLPRTRRRFGMPEEVQADHSSLVYLHRAAAPANVSSSQNIV